ncbi:MAG: DEAD/DEAH box helicase [Enterovibrio sp.]
MLFDKLGLDKRLLTNLHHQGLSEPTPVQAQAIPQICAGNDLLVSSKTGSGKTLAFLLPTLQHCLRQKRFSRQDPRVVILTPTRELAKQVYSELRKMLAGLPYKAALVIGGENFNDQAQIFNKKPELIVATPGRLADHIEHHHVHLGALELLIFDEADSMLDLGFAKELTTISKMASHRNRQTLMFSATLDHLQVNVLAADLLKDAKRIAIGEINAAHQEISQHFYFSDNLDHKKKQLAHLLHQENPAQAIIFTATRDDTVLLAQMLTEQGYKASALHGQMLQNARNRIMNEFARGLSQILVSTDLAARGLDITSISHVFNFDLPKQAQEYVHRIGRTGRAGKMGSAISLVGPKDWQSFVQIEQFLAQSIECLPLAGFEGRFCGAAVKKVIAAKKESKKQESQTPARKPKQSKARDKSFHLGIAVGDQVLKRKKAP